MTEQVEKSLSTWRLELKRYGKSHWLKFYEANTGFPVSDYAAFYKALNNYGEWAMLEAIIATGEQALEGNPFRYCMKIAYNKWKEAQQEEDIESDYAAEIEKAKEVSKRTNLALEKRLEKLRSKKRVNGTKQ